MKIKPRVILIHIFKQVHRLESSAQRRGRTQKQSCASTGIWSPRYSAGIISNNLLSGRFASTRAEIRRVHPRLVWGQSVVVLGCSEDVKQEERARSHGFSVRPGFCVRLHFFSSVSLEQWGCLSGMLPRTWTLAGLGLELSTALPTAPGSSMGGPSAGLPTAAALTPTPDRTPTPAPGPVAALSRLADCRTASECSRAFMRRAATLAVRLPWQP